MKKRTIYITLFLIFIIGVISLIGTFAIDSSITEGNSTKADYLFNITLGDRTNREITIPSYDSKIVDIKISNPNDFNMSYLLYLEGVNSNLSIINISNNEASGVLNSKNTNLIKVFIQNNSSSDITTSIKDIVGFEKEKLSVPSNNTSINKGTYYKVIVKSNNNTYGKVKPNIKLSTSKGTVKYTISPNTGYQYKSTTCNGAVSNNILIISNITSNTTCEVVFEPIKVQVNLDLADGVVETAYTEPKEYTYTVPYNGSYKLETWGAQGSGYLDMIGGYGGYSVGIIQLASEQKLYVNVGGSTGNSTGGYNGGGNGASSGWGDGTVDKYGGGGGATHIATKSGLLSTLGNYKDNILIVSGGGGGSFYHSETYKVVGGHAGGYIGNNGNIYKSSCATNEDNPATGGTQTTGGLGNNGDTSNKGTFGQGGTGTGLFTGGGGGFYGGGGTHNVGCTAEGAAGGSGYIGNSLLTNKYMYCYNCTTSDATDTKTYTTTNTSSTPISNYAKSGNGAAKITLMSDASYKATYNTKYSNLPTPTRAGYAFDGWYTGENGTGTKVTNDTVLKNYNTHTLYAKWRINNVTVTYDGNIFTPSINYKVDNGLTITYDPNTSYLTINGTPTASGQSLGIMDGLSFTEGEKYASKVTYISGGYSNADSDGGCFALDVKNSNVVQVSTRNYADLLFTTSSAETILTINSAGASEGDRFQYWLYFNNPSKWTFTNYTVKLDLTKIESKTLQLGQKYGTMPTPIRTGYTFEGWYTGENGTGTKITSDTVLTNTSDHTLYAKWVIKNVTVNFDLTGGEIETTYTEAKEHTYTVPYNGTYRLDVWGAQAGGKTGGYGGYSTGYVHRNANSVLYAVVGGTGDGFGGGSKNGGYNGGGSAYGTSHKDGTDYFGSGGGGATHIATVSGLLSNVKSNMQNVLIAAGGGGGGIYIWEGYLNGGSGGGFQGVAASNGGGGATQTSNGATGSSSWGQIGGGGGGLYSGGSSGNGGGGGSGYIGNSLLSSKYMYCYNCATSDGTDTKTYTTTNVSSSPTRNYAKSGNGAARITLTGIDSYTVTYGEKYGTLPTLSKPGYTFNGWYTGANGTGTKITSGSTVSILGNHTLYAYWERTQPTEYNVPGSFTYTVPQTGMYKLETWGAQGGNSGGYGSYSAGTVSLTKGTVLYINVGGKGSGTTGGYNGGGTALAGGYGGGGATHIASQSGLLSTFSSKLANVLIVSGGGGGKGAAGAGGNAGGISGNSGVDGACSNKAGGGASQTSGGSCVDSSWCNNGSFGTGGAGKGGNNGGAGGGGGGSGYIGNSLLTDKYMYCYSCATSSATSTKTYSTTNVSGTPTSDYAKSGDGAIRITFIGAND